MPLPMFFILSSSFFFISISKIISQELEDQGTNHYNLLQSEETVIYQWLETEKAYKSKEIDYEFLVYYPKGDLIRAGFSFSNSYFYNSSGVRFRLDYNISTRNSDSRETRVNSPEELHMLIDKRLTEESSYLILRFSFASDSNPKAEVYIMHYAEYHPDYYKALKIEIILVIIISVIIFGFVIMMVVCCCKKLCCFLYLKKKAKFKGEDVANVGKVVIKTGVEHSKNSEKISEKIIYENKAFQSKEKIFKNAGEIDNKTEGKMNEKRESFNVGDSAFGGGKNEDIDKMQHLPLDSKDTFTGKTEREF